jgi:hypothetical protein
MRVTTSNLVLVLFLAAIGCLRVNSANFCHRDAAECVDNYSGECRHESSLALDGDGVQVRLGQPS